MRGYDPEKPEMEDLVMTPVKKAEAPAVETLPYAGAVIPEDAQGTDPDAFLKPRGTVVFSSAYTPQPDAQNPHSAPSIWESPAEPSGSGDVDASTRGLRRWGMVGAAIGAVLGLILAARYRLSLVIPLAMALSFWKFARNFYYYLVDKS